MKKHLGYALNETECQAVPFCFNHLHDTWYMSGTNFHSVREKLIFYQYNYHILWWKDVYEWNYFLSATISGEKEQPSKKSIKIETGQLDRASLKRTLLSQNSSHDGTFWHWETVNREGKVKGREL